MNLNNRISLLSRLGNYILENGEDWKQAKKKAFEANNWFIPSFVDLASETIATQFLQPAILNEFANKYQVDTESTDTTLGLVMAGNIPLVGFHDFMCIFLSGFNVMIKPSSKDDILIRHLVNVLHSWDHDLANKIIFAHLLKGCDAYIATGSNNSGRYFDYYFGKYPHIIRRNRTSVAILSGKETESELENIADDVHLYFGLGCRNTTKIYVPQNFDFIPLLNAFRKYEYFIEHHKYKNNYDYFLAIHLLNNQYYLSSGSILLVENKSLFSPISELHFEYYKSKNEVESHVINNKDVQCITGAGHLSFGQAQFPAIHDFADGVDTMEFLKELTMVKFTH